MKFMTMEADHFLSRMMDQRLSFPINTMILTQNDTLHPKNFFNNHISLNNKKNNAKQPNIFFDGNTP